MTQPGSHLRSIPTVICLQLLPLMPAEHQRRKHVEETQGLARPSQSKWGQGPCRAPRRRTETRPHTALRQLASAATHSHLTRQLIVILPAHCHSSNSLCFLDGYFQFGPFLLQRSGLRLANRIWVLLRASWVSYVLCEGSVRVLPWLPLHLMMIPWTCSCWVAGNMLHDLTRFEDTWVKGSPIGIKRKVELHCQ